MLSKQSVKKFGLIACWKVMLRLVKVKEWDVCGSLVLSNSVTYTDQITCINYGGTCLLPPSLNKQVTVYKVSIGIGFSREVVFLYWWPLQGRSPEILSGPAIHGLQWRSYYLLIGCDF